MKSSDDRLAMLASLLGAGTALLGLRAPMTLSIGVAVGLAGVLLAVRGERSLPAPRLMWTALSLAIAGVLGAAMLAIYEEWQIGQLLSEGMPPAYVTESVRPWVRAGSAVRSVALFAALGLLLGAIVTRFATPTVTRKPDEPSSGK